MIKLMLIVLTIIVIIYVLFAICLFINFIVNNYDVTITNNITKEKYTPKGFKRLKYLLFMSFLWPIALHLK